jgi:hypothetical protein
MDVGGCDIWTDRGGKGSSSYGGSYYVGETVTIFYWHNLWSPDSPGATILITIYKPDGSAFQYGPIDVPAGTHSFSATAGYPVGRRTAVLQILGPGYKPSGLSDTVYFDVIEPYVVVLRTTTVARTTTRTEVETSYTGTTKRVTRSTTITTTETETMTAETETYAHTDGADHCDWVLSDCNLHCDCAGESHPTVFGNSERSFGFITCLARVLYFI